MDLYDYWSIPDWTHDEPTFNYLDAAKMLRKYYGYNIRGINAESTFSGGAMGIGQYVASHLMWDLNLDEKALIEDWYDNAFGPAKAPMKRMMERWAPAISRSPRSWARRTATSRRRKNWRRTIRPSSPAWMTTRDTCTTSACANEWLNAADAKAKLKKAIDISEYLLDINDSRMVHTTRNVDLFRSQEVFAEFHIHNARDPKDPPDGPGWARVRKLSHDDVAALIADGADKVSAPRISRSSPSRAS